MVFRNGFYLMGRQEGEIFEKSIKPVKYRECSDKEEYLTSLDYGIVGYWQSKLGEEDMIRKSEKRNNWNQIIEGLNFRLMRLVCSITDRKKIEENGSERPEVGVKMMCFIYISDIASIFYLHLKWLTIITYK